MNYHTLGDIDPTASAGYIVRGFAPTALDRQAKELYSRMLDRVPVWNPLAWMDKSMRDIAWSQGKVTEFIRSYIDAARALGTTYLGNSAEWARFKNYFTKRGWDDTAAGVLMAEYEQMWKEGRVPQHFENPPPQMLNTFTEEIIQQTGPAIEKIGGIAGTTAKEIIKWGTIGGVLYITIRYGGPLISAAITKKHKLALPSVL